MNKYIIELPLKNHIEILNDNFGFLTYVIVNYRKKLSKPVKNKYFFLAFLESFGKFRNFH